MKSQRGSSLKLRKIRFFKLGGYRHCEMDETELKLFLTALKPRCHMCGVQLSHGNLGYMRVADSVELALCDECLKELAEYIIEMRAGRRY
ncbi:hypothetical protein [Pyrobaculum arsenaticum]|uniref:Uncharacterized protein n=1 Tax=Pyrobaculum arsenaticum TaxID=121277 RepID=A0A7L4P744_9CREN|nr:hypothetical protein [Pyrobaculum arsenaticum]